MLVLLATVVTTWVINIVAKEGSIYALHRYSLKGEQGKLLDAAALALPLLPAALATLPLRS